MSDAVVRVGERIHIITRRSFGDDVRRHFVGEVEQVQRDMLRLRGYAFVFHAGRNEFERRPELRTRILSMADANHIVNVLPTHLAVESLGYRVVEGRTVLTDGRGFTLDINEFGPRT